LRNGRFSNFEKTDKFTECSVEAKILKP